MDIVGIDLGTTFSAISILTDVGRPRIIPTKDGERIMPSAVFFDPTQKGSVLVGMDAKNRQRLYPDNVIVAAKQHMGTDKVWNVPCGDETLEITPTDVSREILKKLIQDAETQIEGKIKEAVVTVPAAFLDTARQGTMEAAEAAGLEKVTLIGEPVAAALYYATEREVQDDRVLVFDLGGGTFDVTIADIEGQDITVVTSQGDSNLGGKNFDKVIARIVNDQFKADTGEAFFEDEPSHELMDQAEVIKKVLSNSEEWEDLLIFETTKGEVVKAKVEITRTQFEEGISSYLGRIDTLIDVALKEADIKADGIGSILLVGGSTRIPCITDRLEKRFGKKPVESLNVDEAVALGAAFFMGMQVDPEDLPDAAREKVESAKLVDVAPGAYGVVLVRDDPVTGEEEDFNYVVIKKNTSLPCEKKDVICTKDDGQTAISLQVTQCNKETEELTFVKILETTSIRGMPAGRPAGQPIDVLYKYDKNGMMECEFTDRETGMNAILDIKDPTIRKKDSQDEDETESDDFTIN